MNSKTMFQSSVSVVLIRASRTGWAALINNVPLQCSFQTFHSMFDLKSGKRAINSDWHCCDIVNTGIFKFSKQIVVLNNAQTSGFMYPSFGPRQANLLLIAYASSKGSGEPAHSRSLARTSAARSYKQ